MNCKKSSKDTPNTNASSKANAFLSNYENINISKNSSAEEIAEKYLRSKLSFEYKHINKMDYSISNKKDYYDNKNIEPISDYKKLNKYNYSAYSDKLNYLNYANDNYSKCERKADVGYDNNMSKLSLYSDIVNNATIGNGSGNGINNVNSVINDINITGNNNIHTSYSGYKNGERQIHTNFTANSNATNMFNSSNSVGLTEFSHFSTLKEGPKNNYYAKNHFLKYEKGSTKHLEMDEHGKNNANNNHELMHRYNDVSTEKNRPTKFTYSLNNSYVQNDNGTSDVLEKRKFGFLLSSKADATHNSNGGGNANGTGTGSSDAGEHNRQYYNSRMSKYYMDSSQFNSKKKNLMQRNKDYVHYLSRRNSILKNEVSIKKDLRKKVSVPTKLENSYDRNKLNAHRYKNKSLFNSFYRREKNKNNEIELINSMNIFNNSRNNGGHAKTFKRENKKLGSPSVSINPSSSSFCIGGENLNHMDGVRAISSSGGVNNSVFDITFLKSTNSDSSKFIDSCLNQDSENVSVSSSNRKTNKRDELLIENFNISSCHTNKDVNVVYYKDLSDKNKIDNMIYSENASKKNGKTDVLPNSINFPNMLISNRNVKQYVDNNIISLSKNRPGTLTHREDTVKTDMTFTNVEREFAQNMIQEKKNSTTSLNSTNSVYTMNSANTANSVRSVNNKSNLCREKEKLKTRNNIAEYFNKKELTSELTADSVKNSPENKQSTCLISTNNVIVNTGKNNVSTNIHRKYVNPITRLNMGRNAYENGCPLEGNLPHGVGRSVGGGGASSNVSNSHVNPNCLNPNHLNPNHVNPLEHNNFRAHLGFAKSGGTKDSGIFVDEKRGSNILPLYLSENKLSNIFNNKIEKNKLFNSNMKSIYYMEKRRGSILNTGNKAIDENKSKKCNLMNGGSVHGTHMYSLKMNNDKNNLNELNNINNYEDYCKYISESINSIPITIKNMNILLALALYFLNFNINNNSTKNELSDDVLIKLLNKFLYCLNLKTCLLKENKMNSNENKYYYIQIKHNEKVGSDTISANDKGGKENGAQSTKEWKPIKDQDISFDTSDKVSFFTFYNKRIVRNKGDSMESISPDSFLTEKGNIHNGSNSNIGGEKKCFYLGENMKIISLVDIYKIAWCLCVLKKNFLYIDLLRILYKEVECMEVEKEFTFCVTYIFKYCNVIEIEDCKTDLSNNIMINLENNNNENLCMYLHLLHICSLHDKNILFNTSHKKNIEKIITYFYDKIENLNFYMCANVLCVLANLNIKNNDYPYFFNKMLNYFRSNIKKMNKSVLLVNVMWALCIIEVTCSEFLKDLSEYVINILHFIPLGEFITISCSFSCQKMLIIKNYFENFKKTSDENLEKSCLNNLPNDIVNEYKTYEILLNEYYEKKKLFPYYFYKKPICHSIIFKILAYNFLHYEQRKTANNNQVGKEYLYEGKNTGNNNCNFLLSDTHHVERKACRSLSVENKTESTLGQRDLDIQNSRFNSSNVSSSLVGSSIVSNSRVGSSNVSSLRVGSSNVSNSRIVRNVKNGDALLDGGTFAYRSDMIGGGNFLGNKHGNNNESIVGGSAFNKGDGYRSGGNVANCTSIAVSSEIQKKKYFKKYNEKKKIKEYYSVHSSSSNYKFVLNSCERILFANLIEDCCNNFDQLNSIHLVELLYTMCILNLDKEKIVKIVEKKIDRNLFSDNYEKLLKKRKKIMYVHKYYSDEEIVNEKNDLTILNYIYTKFVQENEHKKIDIDYHFFLVLDNIYFCKYINDELFLQVIKATRGTESTGTGAFSKLKNILNVATCKEKEGSKEANSRENNESREGTRENDESSCLNRQGDLKIKKEKEKTAIEGEENFRKNFPTDQTLYPQRITNSSDVSGKNDPTFCEKTNWSCMYNNNMSGTENAWQTSDMHNSMDNQHLSGNIKMFSSNVPLNKETTLRNTTDVDNNMAQMLFERYHGGGNSGGNTSGALIPRDDARNAEDEIDDTAKKLNEFKSDLKSTYDAAIAYYNNRTKYNTRGNADNSVRFGKEENAQNGHNTEIINPEIYHNIITKRNIKKIVDSHTQKHMLQEKDSENNFREKDCKKEKNLHKFNFYKLFILLLQLSAISLLSFVIIFVYTSLK
ncbi:conserved Plasmodium protein, unknown function [Plasmodium ovale]|uniref:Uncharacterized protein n=2 Tax=Plasmodium ovale TaxID=36330 RepID=A0A1A8WU89_PLAOA|nr:conserved Plasmodium protein, unknown function [Plasmodium ovale curtisi]SBS96488.1 conserved Plasmodium protein, unknown function [Plasmodium ovale curtisi]SCP05493.1 conserved Plasmodium protein, unknown function [Plasmodium ovale]